MKKKKYDSPMDAALSYITSRMRTRAETQEKLIGLGYSIEETEQTLQRLEELNLINDSFYAAEYIRTRSAAGNYSRAALRYQLRKHKLDKEMAEEAVGSISTEQEYEAAKTAALREWRVKGSLPVTERKKKVFAKLCRSGFDMDVVIGICRELAEKEGEESDL